MFSVTEHVPFQLKKIQSILFFRALKYLWPTFKVLPCHRSGPRETHWDPDSGCVSEIELAAEP
jgi:hypothetical protein